MSDDVERAAALRLRADGQRYTDNRRQLVAVLATASAPLTIPEILERRSDLAQSSVYRNLSILERAGVVQRVHADDEWARYELAEALTDHHHHHVICSGCGRVEDVVLPTRIERLIEEAALQVAADAGFSVDRHRLDLVGRCAACG